MASSETGKQSGRTRLMQEVAAQMEVIEGQEEADFEIGYCVIVVEIRTNKDQVIRVRAPQAPWISGGLLDYAKETLRNWPTRRSGNYMDEDDPTDD